MDEGCLRIAIRLCLGLNVREIILCYSFFTLHYVVIKSEMMIRAGKVTV
jgi:hypothetical protein